jgi:hypothetical protein
MDQCPFVTYIAKMEKLSVLECKVLKCLSVLGEKVKFEAW